MRQWNVRPIAWVKSGDCMLCTSHWHNRDGYPIIQRNGIRKTICRVILIRRHGHLDDEIDSRHSCDNARCISPAHLLIGSKKDNAQDMVKRNRSRFNERNTMAKLTAEQVDAIRSSTGTHQQIADAFHISRTHVTNLKNRKRWSRETMKTLEG